MIGDLFQQYAAKYIGIGRGIPLSNTNQLWGLAWGALVFGELSSVSLHAKVLVIAGSLVMIAGAAAIGMAEAPASELESWKRAMNRECQRYGLDEERVALVLQGDDPLARQAPARRWWEALVVLAAVGIFAWLAYGAKAQPISVNGFWMFLLIVATLVFLGVSGTMLWRRTRFS